MLPCHAGARGDDGNLLGGHTGGTGASHSVGGSHRAQFFSNRIDLVLAVHVRSQKLGYWQIARAGSFKEIEWDWRYPTPLRR